MTYYGAKNLTEAQFKAGNAIAITRDVRDALDDIIRIVRFNTSKPVSADDAKRYQIAIATLAEAAINLAKWRPDGVTRCFHDLSADGVDQTPLDDPAKKWRCNVCGIVFVEPREPRE